MLVIESRYNVLYRDRHGWGCSRVATTRLGGPATRPPDTARKGQDTASPHAGAYGSARVGLSWRGSRDTKIVSCLGATFGSRYSA